MPYDPEYIKKFKELFGDDYEKFLPKDKPAGNPPPRSPGSVNRPTQSPVNRPATGFSNRPAQGSTNRPAQSPVNRPQSNARPLGTNNAANSPVSNEFRSYDLTKPNFSNNNRRASDIPPPRREDSRRAEEFSVNFDFDREYRDVPDDNPLRERREKRSGCLGGLLYAVFIICASTLLASLLWLAATDILGFGNVDEEVNVTISRGFTIDGVTEILHDSGLIKFKPLFKIYAGFSNADEKIAVGSYTLNKNYDYRAIVHGMMARSKTRVEVKVSIPEGYTISQIFTLLESSGVCESDDLWDTAANYDFDYAFLDKTTLGSRTRLEGFLFPNTYNFYLDSTPEVAIGKLLSEFNRKFTEEYTQRAAELGYSVRDIVTIASLIEREAGADSERARIASVIYNRLDSPNFPKLEIDATIFYIIAGTDRNFSTEIDNPYNTYMYEGLPPGPIANPGIESIKAALYPESTDYYFYALGKSNTHSFFKTRSAHEAFVKSDEYGG